MTQPDSQTLALANGLKRPWRDFLESNPALLVPGREIEPKGSIEIWTIQLAQWRVAQKLGIPLLDITVKSGIEIFAPDHLALYAYKRGQVSNEDYARQYYERMRYTLMTESEWWAKHLTQHPRVALACYCAAGKFCHRHLFAPMMAGYLQYCGYTTSRPGEITR